MITRKISFTLIFALLLSPIVVAESLVGAVVKKSPETFLVETAGKEAAKLLLGKAADSIFGSATQDMTKTLTDKMDTMEENIIGTIKFQTQTILKHIDDDKITAHTGAMGDAKDDLHGEVGEYSTNFNWDKDDAVNNHILNLGRILVKSDTYSSKLDLDIQIGEPTSGQWNGFWRSFVPYVSNKALYALFKIEEWQQMVRGKYLADNEKQALTVVSKNIANLENIYKHLERNVPTMPISAGSPLERHLPIQQNLNCVIRTDPDTQLVTSKGEFIRRYAGYDDVADHLPSATNVWRMWGYCRGDKSNSPPTYYGWANTNYEWAAGKHVGPTDDINECRLISTFGRCNSRGIDYGCSMEPNQGHEQDNPSYQGDNPMNVSSPGGLAMGDPGWDNEIPDHDRTVYTKFLWHEAMVLDGSPAHRGRGPNAGQWDKSTLTGQGTFVNYLRTWENTVCAMGPDGKQISQEFPNAPALPHLTNALFDPNSKMPTNNWPKNIIDSLPLTVIKTMTPTVGALTHRDADTSAAYYFIKRNNTTKTAELSKPYQSELSAAHDRSLHYFTEFKDEGLHTAYCQIASMVSIGNQILPTLEARIKQKELVSTKNTPKPSQITTMLDSYRQVSHKLGITKENANAASCFPEAKSNHIVASLNDQMTKANEVSDHMIRSCLKLAAINEWVSTPSRQRRGFGNGILSDLTYKNSRAACNAHYVKHLNNMFR